MSNNVPVENFNTAPEAAVSPSSDTASDARQALSNQAVDSMKEISQARSSDDAPLNGKAPGGCVPPFPPSGREIPVARPVERPDSNLPESIIKQMFGDPAQAKAALADDLSRLIPEADRKTLTDMQGAIIDGDLNKLKGTLKDLSGNPEKLAQLVETLNKQFDKHKLGGTQLAIDGKGNVIIYNDKGENAVSIDPKTGETSLRPIERQKDGGVLLKPGEIINRKADDVLKDIGERLTRQVAMSGIYHQRRSLPVSGPRPGWDGPVRQPPTILPVPPRTGDKPIFQGTEAQGK